MTRLQEDGKGNILFGGNVGQASDTSIIVNGKITPESESRWQTNDIYNVSPGENEAVYFKFGIDNGKYSSFESIYFKQILSSMITLSDTEYTYDGKEKTVSIVVKDGNSVLTKGTDYTISGTTKETKPGQYTVRITGTRTKYIGSVDVTWKIIKKDDTWNYSVKNNIITASCNGECGTAGKHTAQLTLSAPNIAYSGNSYDKASVKDNITSVTGATADPVKYVGRDGTTYAESTTAPTNVGKYTAKVTIRDGSKSATATADFEIIDISLALDNWTYGETANTPSVTIKAGDTDITSSYDASKIIYTYYTDSECTNKTTSENGAASDGAVPKNAGTYYVKAVVPDAEDNPGGSKVKQFTIAKKAVTAKVTAKDKTYDGTADAVVSAVVADSDLVSGDSITIKGITGAFEDKNAGTDKKVTVDSSKKEITGTGARNYDITVAAQTEASINKLTAELTWSDTNLTYTGSEQSVTAEVSNAITGDNFILTYEGNKQTAAGSYTAKVTGLGNDNYALSSDIAKTQTAWKISYLTKGTATVSGTKGKDDWYVTDVTITPEAGYQISTDGTDWKESLTYGTQGSQTAVYYLKEKATGYISDKKKADFKIDTVAPTGEIKIKENSFTAFLNTIAFKHFFKKIVDVKITGADTTSGIAKVEYQKIAKGTSFDKDGTWTEGESFSMTANDKSVIYAKITDKAGNSVIINSDGIVVYTDATATAEETFTKTSTADVTTGITVNGNTIASVMIKNADDESVVATQVDASNYEIEEDRLVLKASYLKNLSAGTYTITVSYNPYGEAYTAESKGEAPDTSVITLNIKKDTGSISNISDISKKYDGNTVTAPTFTTTNDRGTDDANVTIEYKKQGADDSTYTSKAPQNCGKYVVRITVKADENYKSVSETKEFFIDKKEMSISAKGYTGIYDGQAHGITVNVTDPADNVASNGKVVYGTKDTDGKITYGENPVTYKNAGEYTVYYKVTADNYEDAEGSAVVKIAPKTVSLVWSDTEFTYDGKVHKPSAKVNESDIIGSDSVEVKVTGEKTNAGSYTAQATALSDSNYTLGTDASKAYVIGKAAATVTVDSTEKHIGKTDPKFTYKVTGLVDGESLKDISLARTVGETAGSYDITATAKADSNANYDVTFVAGKLTIEDHTVAVDKAVAATCTETGLTEGSHCLVCNEVLVAQTVVDELGHDWSEWVKADNLEKSTCSRCGQVKYRNIENTDTTDIGNLEKDAEVASDSPIAEVVLNNDKSKLIAASGIFTAEEKTAIENGANARVWLAISATTKFADADKQKMEAEAKKIMGTDISDVVYFDIDLLKSVTMNGITTKSQVKEPGTDIEVSVNLPESLVQADSTKSRAYKIIRLHDGAVDSFDAVYDKETDTLTFKTDRFSAYAIAFTDAQLVTGITVTLDSGTLTKKGETVQLTATVTPDNAANKKVIWTSSNSKVATVDENGLVTAVANGTAIITATTEDGGKIATAKIRVNISSDDDNENSNNNKDNQSAISPKTGDTSNMALWIMLFMAAFAETVSLLIKGRKENCR